jgi:hypothetical protein
MMELRKIVSRAVLAAALIGGATALTATSADARVVCNRWHCWRVYSRPYYDPYDDPYYDPYYGGPYYGSPYYYGPGVSFGLSFGGGHWHGGHGGWHGGGGHHH